MSSLSGRVQTVLGLVDPNILGQTLTHEHLTMSYDCCYVPPSNDDAVAAAALKNPFRLENAHWLRQNPYSSQENLQLLQETDAVREELHAFRRAGGGCVVENTTTGIQRDVHTLRQLSVDTGVHVIAGAGFYVDATHSEHTRNSSVEQLTEVLLSELLVGADGTDVRCGVIGELGCSWPITESEVRVLRAAASAQQQLGCPIIIHPGRNPLAPAHALRVLQEEGGDAAKTVMSHLDRTIFAECDLLEFSELGSFLEFDLFGTEMLNYHFDLSVDMPSDSQRIHTLSFLMKEGLGQRLLIAHDIHTKNRLTKYGGHGYSHILNNIVPKMLQRGFTQEQVHQILVDNPKRWLTFK
ncbi:phosphotriesterase-related protein-like isoform X1 [Gouania willdenowi]|uniref:N-acetyltaurine hydrolase n=1 Tax=Gouania willdenowi TaxID=441366 RepID=A0A8C5HWF2_GOUWI|nr:phosphotriesterase-related protein-like [Gouania willdenowi]XP_028328890.1 phosphotriesterase-related protein-like [Gouania willdenowi]XP_028329562.1 phosphotriesterase-related protein-like isoform X1 [Gouania willdenowi]XP_028329564.1 phosphotriesterase-related protein-like isoform X1 [Gouania willdenowi]